MPVMKNISERKFVVAGIELAQGKEGTFAKSVVERHVSLYPNELVLVGDLTSDNEAQGGEDPKDDDAEGSEEKPAKRGRKPKVQEAAE